MTPRGLILAGLTALAAWPAAAQSPAPDPIDSLLHAPARTYDPEEPDTAAATPGAAPQALPPPAPFPYLPPSRSTLTAPVFLGETGRTPDPPPTPADIAYDSRIRASAASAQGFQGPMEGGWTLAGGGRELYGLQLSDRDGALEGAWRDLRRPGALDASGFIDGVERSGTDVTLRFAAGAVATLHAADGRWVGELSEAGRTQAVSLTRRVP